MGTDVLFRTDAGTFRQQYEEIMKLDPYTAPYKKSHS